MKKKLKVQSFFFAAEGEPQEVMGQFLQKLGEAFAAPVTPPKKKVKRKS